MPPKPEKHEKSTEELIAQIKEMQLRIEAITTQQENFQQFLASQIPTLIREQLSGYSHPRPTPTPKPPKINLLPFDGSNPLDWIFQAEQYFDLTKVPPSQSLTYVPFFIQGEALGWYKWMAGNHQISTWEAFTRAVELIFGPSYFENHQAALFKPRQLGSVMEYQQHFETLSNRVFGMPADMLLNCFISDLKPEIQRELSIIKPHSLSHAIGLSKLLEAKF